MLRSHSGVKRSDPSTPPYTPSHDGRAGRLTPKPTQPVCPNTCQKPNSAAMLLPGRLSVWYYELI